MMSLNGSGPTPAAGALLLRREEGHAEPEWELRESLKCEMCEFVCVAAS